MRERIARVEAWSREIGSTALPPWIVARVLTFGAFAAAVFVVDNEGPLRHASKTTVRGGLLSWDAAYYADIARHGYTARLELRFFPLVPLVARMFGYLGVSPRIALVIFSNCAALIAGWLLYRLARFERGDEALALRATWLLALAPAAFVFVMGYADSTALALAIGAFLTVRKRQWLPTFALALAAGLARPAGFLLAVPIAIEAARGLRSCRPKEWAPRAAAVLGAPIGTGLFLIWVRSRFGDALLPYRVQTQAKLKGPFQSPITTISHALRGLFRGDQIGTGLHVPWLLLAVVLLVVCARHWPLSYSAYAAALLLSATVSANLDSLERYALGAFPLVLAAAGLTKSPRIERAVLVILGSAMSLYALLAFVHAYVP